MSRSIRRLVFVLCLMLLSLRAHGQAVPSADPYRNFLGVWSGIIVVNTENMPSKVELTITEEKNRSRMRWDYVFGVEGEKGYKRTTKWIVLSPAKARMDMHFKGYPDRPYGTFGLDQFTRDGLGRFTATAQLGLYLFSRCTFDLQAGSLRYLWEQTEDGKTYAVYSDFQFTRKS